MNFHILLFDLFLVFLVGLLGVCFFRPDVAQIVGCLLVISLIIAVFIARQRFPEGQ